MSSLSFLKYIVDVLTIYLQSVIFVCTEENLTSCSLAFHKSDFCV